METKQNFGRRKIRVRFLNFNDDEKKRVKNNLTSKGFDIIEDDKYDIQIFSIEDRIPHNLKDLLNPDVPAIFLSKNWNSEKINEISLYGVSDFVHFDDVDRLAFAVQREVKLSKARKFDRFYLSWIQEHDITTDFLNRYSFLSKVNELINKNGNSFYALYIICINHFDSIILHLGRDFEDVLLSHVAEKISKLLNPSVDVIGRISGDKFAVLRRLEKEDFEDEVKNFAEDILKNIIGTTTIEGKHVKISLNIGISIYPIDGQTVDELIRGADIALLNSKTKDTYSFCSDITKELMRKNSEIFSEIFEAIGEGRFYLVFQPVVCLKDGRIHLFEALLRWRRKLVSPEQIIKIAETAGAIYELSKFIFGKVLEVAQKYPKYRFSINISPRHLLIPDLYREIFSDFVSSGVEPSRVYLEISEKSIYEDVIEVRDHVNELYKMGFQFAIDDFGSGQSSIAILRLVPADIIKVDKSIVHGAIGEKLGDGVDKSGKFEKSLLETIFFFSRKVNKMVAAEGVEKDEHLRGVRELGFDLAQGFYISQPFNEEELDVILPLQSLK